MDTTLKVLLASANPGKVREVATILPGIHLVNLREVSPVDLDEPGEDYASNAVAKAVVASRALGMITLADDSGLEVDALGGAPGWRSARYGGAHGDDAGNRARLLAALAGVPAAARAARFRCCVAVADVSGPLGARVLLAYGACAGRITTAERGTSGFGYDPLFEVDGLGRTMAELEPTVKDRLSHRGRALTALRPALDAYLAARTG